MCPGLFIVARSNSSSAEPKLRQAGVDRVVNTHEIGGSRMAALVLEPDVVDFLGVVMHDEQLSVRLAETPVTAGGPFAGLAVSACGIAESTGATVLAVRRNESFVTNPAGRFCAGGRRRADRARHQGTARRAQLPGGRLVLGPRRGCQHSHRAGRGAGDALAGPVRPGSLSDAVGDGVIGNTAGSGPAIGGSSPPPRTRRYAAPARGIRGAHLPRSSSGLGRHPLKVVARVQIPYGVPRPGQERGP